MESDWGMVQSNFICYCIYMVVWYHSSFKYKDVTYLYTTDKEVHAKKNVMKSLNKPIILVEAKSTGNSSRASNSVMRLLSDIFFLCINVRVIMTSKILKN